MSSLLVATLEPGELVEVDEEQLATLAASLRGNCLVPGEPDYDEARTIWNEMIDRKPGLIVQCRGAADVALATKFARDRNLLVSIKAGGHNIAGKAVCDGGLMIDLSRMTSVHVDPQRALARVEAGALLGDVDKETQAHGLAVPVGINSTTGTAGLTLGGGFGWTSRKFGLTIDSLIGADVVTADGQFLHASETENADLFWALRGGGGNFGIVTSFEFKLHRVGPDVLTGLIVHPFDNAKSLLQGFRELADSLPDETTCWVVLRQAPPLPFLSEEWHGKEVLVFAFCHCGDLSEGQEIVEQIRALGPSVGEFVGVQPLVAWQTAFDPLVGHGARNYWKSHDLITFSDPVIDDLIEAVGNLPGPENEVFLAHMGGQANRVPATATAFPARDGHFVANIHARWREAELDDAHVNWARGLFDKLAPHSLGTAYVNFMPEDDADRVSAIYGPNYERLAKIKAKYDPTNFFRMNQNITPSA